MLRGCASGAPYPDAQPPNVAQVCPGPQHRCGPPKVPQHGPPPVQSSSLRHTVGRQQTIS